VLSAILSAFIAPSQRREETFTLQDQPQEEKPFVAAESRFSIRLTLEQSSRRSKSSTINLVPLFDRITYFSFNLIHFLSLRIMPLCPNSTCPKDPAFPFPV
jgi:hypothetical protein